MDDKKFDDDVIQPIKEFAEEKRNELVSDFQEKTANVEERIDGFTETLEIKREEIAEETEKIKESFEENLDETADKINDLKDELREEVDESLNKAENFAEQSWDSVSENAEEIRDGIEEKAEDMISSMRSSIDQTEDTLEQVPVNRHEPVIPKYVPKNYTREDPEMFETTESRGYASDGNYDGYPTIDDVQPAPNAIKNASGGKSSNTMIWIVLAILVVLCMIGCCFIQAFFGLIKVLGG